LEHLDDLLPFADPAAGLQDFLPHVMPYVPVLASRLDDLGGHLELLRPHLPVLLPLLHVLYPYTKRFKPYLDVSRHADVLVFYFGWLLRIPGLHYIFYVPGMPAFCNWLARILPRWPLERARLSRLRTEALLESPLSPALP
jgi:hypothetical protein